MYHTVLLLCFGCLVVHGSPDAQSRSSSSPTAQTRNGTYAGVYMPQFGQDAFYGMPFADAPRFSLAESLTETWDGTRDAVKTAPSCAGFGSSNQIGIETSENCLNLNIVRPAGLKSGAKMPVMVWIYGGGFTSGSINDPRYNTSYIIQTSMHINKPVIVVSISYRLSAMGWLYSLEMQSQGVTNIGLRDQWKALEWIKENIAGFGGDPDNVTIWGESAGAFSIGALTLAYGGDNSGLFQRAIMSSGTSFASHGTLINAQTVYNDITNSTGCHYAIDSLQCLRDLPFETLNTTLSALSPSFQLMFDGDILRNDPIFAYDHVPPLVAPIDMLLGCNSDDGMSIPIGGQVDVPDTAFFSYILTAVLGFNDTMATEALALWPEDAQYPPYSEPMSLDWSAITATVGVVSGNQTRRFYGFVNDVVMHAGRRFTAQNWAKLTEKSAYSYRWDVDPSRIPLVYTPGLGVGFAQHGADLNFQFGIPEYYPQQYPIAIPIPNVPAMRNVSYAMQVHFIAFAATGNPNAHHIDWIPKWPAYIEGQEQNFVYNATLQDILNLHIEDDNYRADQLQWVNERWRFVNNIVI